MAKNRNFMELVELAVSGCAREGKNLVVDAQKDKGGHYTIAIKLGSRKATFSTQADAIAYLTGIGAVEREIVMRDEGTPLGNPTKSEPEQTTDDAGESAEVKRLKGRIKGINKYLEYDWQMKVCECARIFATGTDKQRERAGRRYDNLVAFKAEKIADRTKYELELAELLKQ